MVGHPVTSYEVSLDGGTTWTTLTTSSSGSTVTATVPGLTNDSAYAFVVRAVNDNGNGTASTPAGVTPTSPASPDAPTDLAATPGDGQGTLTFTASADVPGHPTTSYQVSFDSGTTWTTLTTSTSGSTVTTTVAGLTNGTTYTVVVRALNDNGTGNTSSAASLTPSSTASPAAPTNLAATPGDGQGTLTFTAPAPVVGHPVLRYEVSTDGDVTWTTLPTSTAGTTVTATVTGLNDGQTYPVAVRAVNDNGNGERLEPDQPDPVVDGRARCADQPGRHPRRRPGHPWPSPHQRRSSATRSPATRSPPTAAPPGRPSPRAPRARP